MNKMNEKQKNFFIGSETPAYRIQILGVNSIERGSIQRGSFQLFKTFQSFQSLRRGRR